MYSDTVRQCTSIFCGISTAELWYQNLSFTDGVPDCVEKGHVGINIFVGLKGPAVYMATIPSWLLYEFIYHSHYFTNQNAQSIKSDKSKGNGAAMIWHLKYRKSTICFVPIDLIGSHFTDSINQITCFCFTVTIILAQSVNHQDSLYAV